MAERSRDEELQDLTHGLNSAVADLRGVVAALNALLLPASDEDGERLPA